MFKKYSKVQIRNMITKTLAIILGNLVLAFGSAIFLIKLNIISGGLSGIGIIFQHFIGDIGFFGGTVVDIIVFILSWILWLVGFFFVSKEFAFKTLISTVVYPLFLALFLRINVFNDLAKMVSYYGVAGEITADTIVPIGNLLLCAIFGGVFVGTGVSLTFIGGGSTGGVDVLIALVAKYTPVKESTASFAIDATIVVLGMILIPKNFVPALCGIVSAFITSILIEFVYVGNQTSYQVDIISDKWQEISKFAQEKLERGATIINAEGGYKGDDRVILRIVFDKRQYQKLRTFISETDPKAFVTFTRTNAVYGEGFKRHINQK